MRYTPTNGNATPIVDVRVGEGDGLYELRSRGVCGSFTIDGVDVVVRPRMSAGLLQQMVSRLAGARSVPTGRLEEGTDFESRIDASFLDQVEGVVRAGLASAYRVRSEVGSAPRGAIDFNWFSNPVTIDLRYSYPDFSRDIPENQQLSAALGKITATARTRGRPAARARQLSAAFEGIVPDATPLALHRSTIFDGYRAALALADWILRAGGVSVSSPGSSLLSQGLMYEPARLYEAYVQSRVEKAAQQFDGWSDKQGGVRPAYLDTGHRWRVFPDAVIGRGHDCLAVVDAKYKPQSSVPDRDDLYQALAYAHAFRTSTAILICATNRTRSTRFRLGQSDGVQVTVIEVDISQDLIESLDSDLQEELSQALSDDLVGASISG